MRAVDRREPAAARSRSCSTESCLLAVLGGAAGLLVARWTLDLIASLLPDDAAATMPLDARHDGAALRRPC